MTKRIALYGIFGLYNYGCEAIVRGAVKFINEYIPGSEITYYSHNYEYDKKQISDLNIKVEKVELNSSFAKRLINKILKLLKINYQFDLYELNSMYKNSDVLFSIGGDMYTIPRIIRENNKYPYYNRLVNVGNIAKRKGLKLVIYGASIGPFGSYGRAIGYYRKHLNTVDLIIAREQKTIDYLFTIGVKSNVELFPDPAFSLSEISNTTEKDNLIGINLSPLSNNEIYGNNGHNSLKKSAELLESILNKTHKKMLLIPHVRSHDKNDDDLEYLKLVYDNISEVYKDRVSICNKEGFLNVKQDLKKCEIVVASRMHCAINAVSEGIPTIFLAYSNKAYGMAQYVYKNDDWVLDLKDIDDNLLNMVLNIAEKKSDIENYLEKRIKELLCDKQYEECIDKVKKL